MEQIKRVQKEVETKERCRVPPSGKDGATCTQSLHPLSIELKQELRGETLDRRKTDC